MRTDIRHVAVIGTGVIGASWAALFLARGLSVAATDPAPGAEERLRRAVDANWPVLERMGLAEGASPAHLRFAPEPEGALEGADFVQENGPERLDLKRELFGRLGAATPGDVVIATSSSGLMVSDIQDACPHPERVVLGHPFNPPHLIPLVEVVGGRATAPEAVEAALAFYERLGKRPIRMRKEVPGHIANRLQAALWREAFHLVETGVASVADVDVAIAHGPGLRWAILGAFANLDLAGGEGGIAHLLAHLGPPTEEWWADLGAPRLSPALNAAVIEGTNAALAGVDRKAMVRARDALLVQFIAAKAERGDLP